jgi:hypothetical protein
MGGTESQTLLLLEHYDRDRFVMDVCCVDNMKGGLSERFAVAVKEGISSQFTFTGIRHDVHRILSASDGFFCRVIVKGFRQLLLGLN